MLRSDRNAVDYIMYSSRIRRMYSRRLFLYVFVMSGPDNGNMAIMGHHLCHSPLWPQAEFG